MSGRESARLLHLRCRRESRNTNDNKFLEALLEQVNRIRLRQVTSRLQHCQGGAAGETRRNIDTIVATVINESSCHVLETNLYPFETPSGSAVPTGQKRTDVLEALLRYIAPKVVIAHGKHAVDFLFRAPLASGAIVIPAHHLSTASFRAFPEYLGRAAIRACRTLSCS